MSDEWVKVDTGPLRRELAAREKAAAKATTGALREAAAVVRKAARDVAPVFGGDKRSVHIRAVKKARRAGVNLMGEKLEKGASVEAANQVVAGLLRDSITTTRVSSLGDVQSIKVLPRGPRVFLYSAKENAREHFMEAGLAAGATEMGRIHEKAWGQAMRGER